MAILLAAATTIVALAAATAQAREPYEAEMQTLYNADGSGRLFANGSNTSWEMCNPSLSECQSAGSTREIGTGAAPVGSIFRLQGTITGPTWHGNITLVTPPSVQGTLAAGELVTPVLAGWQGGWEGSFDQTQLAACATPTGEGCTSISAHKYVDGCPSGGAVLDPSFVGDYLRIADIRLGPGSLETAEGWLSPYGHPILPAQGNTAAVIVGQIGPATHESTPACGPKPLPEAWISSLGVAKVSCAFGCEATLVAGHAGRTARTTLKVPATGLPSTVTPTTEPQPNATTLAIAASTLTTLGGGKTNFAVEVGGEIFARQSLTLPSKKHRKHHHKRHHKHHRKHHGRGKH